MRRLIISLLCFFILGCGVYNNFKLDGPVQSEAIVWAELDQNTQLARPFGSVWIDTLHVWYFFNITPPGEYQPRGKTFLRDIEPAGVLGWPYQAIILSGFAIDWSGSLLVDIVTLPYTIPCSFFNQ